jgi:transcriptional regulator of aromatic amino acid metabolism
LLGPPRHDGLGDGARAPLFAQVTDGRFSASLYYRINTVTVEMRAPADMP